MEPKGPAAYLSEFVGTFFLVLGICGWILLKLVIGLIAGLATIIVVVACIIGVVWALSKF